MMFVPHRSHKPPLPVKETALFFYMLQMFMAAEPEVPGSIPGVASQKTPFFKNKSRL
jgi:hypothetical protein